MSKKMKGKTTRDSGTRLMGLCAFNVFDPETSLFDKGSVMTSLVSVMGTENRGFRPMWRVA